MVSFILKIRQPSVGTRPDAARSNSGVAPGGPFKLNERDVAGIVYIDQLGKRTASEFAARPSALSPFCCCPRLQMAPSIGWNDRAVDGSIR